MRPVQEYALVSTSRPTRAREMVPASRATGRRSAGHRPAFIEAAMYLCKDYPEIKNLVTIRRDNPAGALDK